MECRFPSTRFHTINLGCKVNRVEADSLTASLLAAGAVRSALSDAAVVLVHTCTVTGEADTKSRKAARRALREAPEAVVIVCGCGAHASPEQFLDMDERCLIIADKQAALLKAGAVLGVEVDKEDTISPRVGGGYHTRASVKIQDGCNNSCSYCIVPQARGAARSVPLRQALREINVQVAAGAQEVVLTGIDLGSYRDGDHTLESVLEEALKLSDTFRIRLSSLELPGVTDRLIHLIGAFEGRICAHLHIPLQSGSDAVLGAMKRRYNRTTYLKRAMAIKSSLSHVALSTDVIVGFPGETDENFEATCSLCREVGFSHLHIFRYSSRPSTRAASLPGHVPAELIAERALALRNLANELTEAEARSRVGTTEMVLFEDAKKGRSESYYLVKSTERAKPGSLALMRLVGYEQDNFIAEMC